jgi:cytochrome c-type biogenesis protein CcmH/NrfG
MGNWQASPSESSSSVKPDASNVSGSFTKKMLDLETYLSKNPSDTTHIIMLARLYQDGHKPEKAVEMYQKVLALHKTNSQLWLDLILTCTTFKKRKNSVLNINHLW